MYAPLVDLVALPLTAALGVFSGWFTCRHARMNATQQQLERDGAKIRDVLSGFNRLASVVASDIRSHKRSLAHIADELTAIDLGEARCVAEVVQTLVKKNQEMEQRLLDTESKLVQLTRELEARSAEASTDSLTNLANRRAFNDELARRYAEHERNQRPMSVLFVDVDHFKQFNDSHGHLAGDAVLRCVSAVLRQTVRGMDMVARYGGEEFSVVLPNTPLVAAVAVAERARAAIERMECHFEGKVYSISVSAGVAELRPGEQTSALLSRADACMYAAKAAGRNCTHYHDGTEIRCATANVRAKKPRRRSEDKTTATASVVLAAPAGETTAAPPAVKSVGVEIAALGDRSAFCHAVRSRLAEWKREGGRLCIALVAIDKDSIPSGSDITLRELVHSTVARQLIAAVREMDVVGAYTEECFGVLLVRAGLHQAPHIAGRLHRLVSGCTVTWNEQPVRLAICIGLAEVQEGDDTVQLIGRAEQAMHAAFQAGGGCTYLHTGHDIVDAAAPAATGL